MVRFFKSHELRIGQHLHGVINQIAGRGTLEAQVENVTPLTIDDVGELCEVQHAVILIMGSKPPRASSRGKAPSKRASASAE